MSKYSIKRDCTNKGSHKWALLGWTAHAVFSWENILLILDHPYIDVGLTLPYGDYGCNRCYCPLSHLKLRKPACSVPAFCSGNHPTKD